jgi:glycosyltransferase involved in cell wall biosynthesis
LGPDDWPLIVPPAKLALVNLIGDMIAGRQFETDEATLEHFAGVIERTRPDALQLEHPFMWPLAKRLRQMVGMRRLRLIYSSHNVEGPLKEEILTSWSVARELRCTICAEIEEMESELCREADLVVCVSSSDRNHYCRARAPADVIIVPNGVDRQPQTSRFWANETAQRVFEGRRFIMTVGSAHPPNIDGLCHYLIAGGIFCVPPRKSFAICGGVSDPVFHHPEYQRYTAANADRVQFFAKIDDDELWALKQSCHGVFLPLRSGGGSNLKTAEALALGKWTVATPTALRGFEAFSNAEGVILADDPASFRRSMHDVLQRPALEISAASRATREALYWDRSFADSGLAKVLSLPTG